MNYVHGWVVSVSILLADSLRFTLTDYGTVRVEPTYRPVTVDIGAGEARELCDAMTEYLSGVPVYEGGRERYGFRRKDGFIVGSTRFTYDPTMRWHAVEFGLGLDVGDHSLIRACMGELDVHALTDVLRAWLRGEV